MKTQIISRLAPMPSLLLGLACLWAAESARAVGNDNFADAWVIPSIPWVTNSSNADATRETGEPYHRGSTVGHTVWWRWTAPSAGPMQINTIGSSFNSVLGVYTGTSVSALTEVASGRGNHVVDFIAVAGVTYQIAVESRDAGSWGNFTFRLLVGVNPPANDNFTNATVIGGASYALTVATNSGATWEPGEPAHAGVPGGKSLWWQWTAPVTSRYQLDTAGSSLNTLLAVYTGTSLTNLSVVASNDDVGGGYVSSLVTFNAVAGTNYYFAVDGWQGRSEGYWFNLNLNPPPANDNFSNATVLVGSTVNVSNATTVAASLEAGEPQHAGNSGGHSIWYRWTAPASGLTQVDTMGSGFDTLLGVYTGTSVSNLTMVATNDNWTNLQSLVTFTATVGTTYSIAVDGWYAASGSVTLHVIGQTPTGPLNDDFANAIVLTGSVVNTNGSNTDATKETGEPDHAGYPGGKSVWWSWIAPTSGMVQVDTIGSSFDTLLAIYTGSVVNALTEIASDDQSGGNDTSRLLFNASAGTTYQIAVDGWNALSGNIVLHLVRQDTLLQAPSFVISNSQPHLSFQINGPEDRTVVIQVNTDLNQTNWTSLQTNVLTGGLLLFTDPAPATEAQKFYRARLP